MSITCGDMTVGSKSPSGQTLFCVSFSSADANAGEEVKAAPSSGAIYITAFQVSYSNAAIGTLGDGSKDLQFLGTAGGLASPVFRFIEPIKIADTTALTLTAAAGNVTGYVEGFVS